MVKLAHFSDVHLTARPLGWTVRDVFGKRTTGWVNVNVLGRGSRFQHAESVVDVLRRDSPRAGLDHLVFSGDATMLGFDTEMAAAPRRSASATRRCRRASRCRATTMCTSRAPSGAAPSRTRSPAGSRGTRTGKAIYPFARKVGHVWLIAVNSAKANFWLWDASGKVGETQLARFRELCAATSTPARGSSSATTRS